MVDLRTSLRDAAATPRRDVGVDELRAEKAQRRQRSRRLIATGAVGCLVLVSVGILATRGGESKDSLRTVSPDVPQTVRPTPTSSPSSDSASPSDPLSQVGSGWLLTLDATPDRSIVNLIDPSGTSTVVGEFTGEDAKRTSVLLDWSGDHQRAMFTNADHSEFTELELKSGSLRRIDVGGHSYGDEKYSEPNGLAIWIGGPENEEYVVRRYDLDGNVQLELPSSFDDIGRLRGVFPAPDGAMVALDAQDGIALLRNDGTVIRTIDLSELDGCLLSRWWTATELLASCASGTQLYRVPVSGDAPIALSAPLPDTGPVYGVMAGLQVSGQIYVQQLGACGTAFLGLLQPDGSSTTVGIPGYPADATVSLLGTDGARLLLQVEAGESEFGCSAGQDLVWFDPATEPVSVVANAAPDHHLQVVAVSDPTA